VSYVSRLNYGVIFKPVRKVTLVTDVWMQVFDVPLPNIPVSYVSQEVPPCDMSNPDRRIRCLEDRSIYTAVYNLYVNMTQEVRSCLQHLHDLLPAEKNISRSGISKRALFPTMGWVLSGLFGTATEQELLPIERQIKRISQGVAMMAQGLEVENDRLVGFMSLADDRMNDIVNMTLHQEEEMQQLRTYFLEELSKLPALQAMVTVLAHKLEQYVSITRDLREFQTGVELLLHGFLTPVLVDKETLQQTIHLIQRELQSSFPGLQMVWTHPSDLYNAHDFLFGKHGQRLLIQVHLPVTSIPSPMVIYEIQTFPVAVPGKPDHVTQIKGLPRYLFVDEITEYYVSWEEQLEDLDSDLMYVLRQNFPFRSFDLAPSCGSALYLNNVSLVRQLCGFHVERSTLVPDIKFLTDSEILIINMPNISVECKGESLAMPGCQMCVRKLSCGCMIQLLSTGDYRPERFWPAKLGNCTRGLNISESLNVVNMAALQAFFSDVELGDLKGDSLLTRELQVKLPNFNHFQHKFQELLAADDRKRFDLQKFSQKVKNDSKIFHGIADVVTEQMQQVLYDNGFYQMLDSGFASPSWWLKWGAIILSAISLCLALYLCYRLRVIAASLALLSAKAAALEDLPKELTYGLSGQQLVKEELRVGNSTLTFEPKNWHMNLSLICLVAALIMILVLGYWLYQLNLLTRSFLP